MQSRPVPPLAALSRPVFATVAAQKLCEALKPKPAAGGAWQEPAVLWVRPVLDGSGSSRFHAIAQSPILKGAACVDMVATNELRTMNVILGYDHGERVRLKLVHYSSV